MPSVNFKIFLKVVTDVFLLIAVALPVLIFYLIGVPYKRGFFCDDESIRYPYKDSTVTTGVLYAYGTIIPVMFIVILEYINIRRTEISSVGKEKMRKWFWSLYRYIGIFLFGCAASQLTVDICKYSIGRLRPHFINVCDPDWTKADCINQESYVTQDVCTPDTEEEEALLREARLSFMSGHASFSAFTMFYLIFYLQFRFSIRQLSLLRPVLQYIFFALALYTTLSRVSDYKHHWSDVFAGFINGLAFAVYCAFWVANIRSSKVSSKNSDEIRMCNLNEIEPRRPDSSEGKLKAGKKSRDENETEKQRFLNFSTLDRENHEEDLRVYV